MTDAVARLATRRRSSGVGLLPLVALVADLVVVLLSVLLSVLLRRSTFLFDSGADVSVTAAVLTPLIVVGWLSTLYLLGAYKTDVFGAGTDEYKRVLNASMVAAGLVGVGCYLGQVTLSRGFYLLLVLFGTSGLILTRYGLRRLLHSARMRGKFLQQVLIAGSPAHVDEVAAVLRRERWLGYHVFGALTPSTSTVSETPGGVPVIGNADDVSVMQSADVVFFAGGSDTSARQMRKIVWELEAHDVQLVVAPSVSETSSDRVRVRPVGGLPLMHLAPPKWSEAARIGKRTFDLVVTIGLLVVMSPLFALATVSIKLHDRGPVLFRQLRTGRHGFEFNCIKFRTMVVDAEERLAEVQEQAGHQDGLFKLKDDPRITRPGAWLRRYSLDELPQLLNVLRGDMSLVGPRPPLPSEVARYGEDIARRLHVRPGLTGLWQVSGRSDLSWEDAVRLDLYYVDNWSMLQDVAILFRTFGAVVASRGAY